MSDKQCHLGMIQNVINRLSRKRPAITPYKIR